MEHKCPECGAVVECMCVIGADESLSGKTERLYLCNQCLSSWENAVDENAGTETPLKRYFFG